MENPIVILTLAMVERWVAEPIICRPGKPTSGDPPANLNTLLQTPVEVGMQGRVFSLNQVIIQLPVTWLIGGLLAEGLGYFGTLSLGGGVLVLPHLVAYWRTPVLRQVEPSR
jgi:hypothetical protein